jgi:hypothetical protein
MENSTPLRAIIDRTVPPINPLDPEKAHMYIYNNIFFSYATDGRDFYKDIGGDKAAYASVSNDLKGIIAFNKSVSIITLLLCILLPVMMRNTCYS